MSWIALNGEGKLFGPTDDFKYIIKRCDTMFDVYNGKCLRICNNPLEQVVKLILGEHPTFPPNVVRLYSKVKFFARICQLNQDIQVKHLNKSVRVYKNKGQFAA